MEVSASVTQDLKWVPLSSDGTAKSKKKGAHVHTRQQVAVCTSGGQAQSQSTTDPDELCSLIKLGREGIESAIWTDLVVQSLKQTQGFTIKFTIDKITMH